MKFQSYPQKAQTITLARYGENTYGQLFSCLGTLGA